MEGITNISSPHLWAIRAAFIMPVLLVLGQFVMIRSGFGEPYPALMMPGFKETRTAADGTVAVESVGIIVGFDDGSTAPTTLRALFAGVPSSHYWTMANNFRHTTADEEPVEARSALKNWIIRNVTPIRDHLAQQRRMGRPIQPDTKLWLQRRFLAMYPARTVTRIEFEWRVEHRRPHHGLERAPTVVADRYVIDLTGAADAQH